MAGPRRAKGFVIRCGAVSAERLAGAIETFARAAYPPGGSECAQAAREGLHSLAERIRREAVTDEGLQLNKRQRPMLHTAVQWVCEQMEGSAREACEAELLPLVARAARAESG